MKKFISPFYFITMARLSQSRAASLSAPDDVSHFLAFVHQRICSLLLSSAVLRATFNIDRKKFVVVSYLRLTLFSPQ